MPKTSVNENESFDYAFKIMVLGDPSAERTQFIIKYISGFFIEEPKVTIGVDFYSKIVDFRGRKVKLQLWDFGGEERFRFLLHQYCKGANAAFFLYDVSNRLTLEHLPDWTHIIREHAGDLPIILIGNKKNKEADRKVLWEEGAFASQQYNLTSFFEVSIKTGENFEEAFKSLLGTLGERYLKIPFHEKQVFDAFKLRESYVSKANPIIAFKIEQLLKTLGSYKEFFPEVFSSYQAETFTKVKINLKDPSVQMKVDKFINREENNFQEKERKFQEAMIYTKEQERKKKPLTIVPFSQVNLQEFRESRKKIEPLLCKATLINEFLGGSSKKNTLEEIEKRHKSKTQTRVNIKILNYNEQLNYWLLSTKSLLIDLISKSITSKFKFICQHYNIYIPDRYTLSRHNLKLNTEVLIDFFAELKTVGVTDLKSTKEIIKKVEFEQLLEFEAKKSEKKLKTREYEKLNAEFDVWWENNRESELKSFAPAGGYDGTPSKEEEENVKGLSHSIFMYSSMFDTLDIYSYLLYKLLQDYDLLTQSHQNIEEITKKIVRSTEFILDNVEDCEKFFKTNFVQSWEQVGKIWLALSSDAINKAEFIRKGMQILGVEFIRIILYWKNPDYYRTRD